MEVEEIDREPVDAAPQILRIVCHHGDKFDVVEEEEANVEVKALRANLSVMMGRIEASSTSLVASQFLGINHNYCLCKI